MTLSIVLGGVDPSLGAQIAFTDDFSAGINPVNWAIRSNQPLYSVDTSSARVRFSKPVTNNFNFQFIGLALMFAAQGNFDARVDFTNANISLGSGSPGNQVQLNTRFGGQDFVVVRSSEIFLDHNAHVFINPPSSLQGTRGWSATFGTLRVTRTNAHVRGYIDGTLLYENDYNTNDATFSFTLQNNGTADATAVTFDNFQVTADSFVRVPPDLEIQLAEPNVVVSWPDRQWPDAMAAFTLWSTPNLSGPSAWQTNGFTLSGNRYSLTNPASTGPKFYRLMQGR